MTILEDVARLLRVEAAARAVVEADDHPPQDRGGLTALAEALTHLRAVLES